MKKARKLLVALLVLTFVMSTFSVGFAAEDKAEKAPSHVVRAQGLGYLKGYDDGDLKLDQPITRAEALAFVVRISGMEKTAELMKGATKFADANIDPSLEWATGYINLGEGHGIVNGYPDGTFKGNAQVTYAEMAKMLLYAMKYDVTVEGGVWPAAVMGKAESLHVFDKVSASPNAPAVRGDVVKMIDNSLRTKHLVQKGYGDLAFYEEDPKMNFLAKMNIVEIERTVTAIPRVKDKLKSDRVELNGERFKVSADEDLELLLGQRVKAYIVEDEDDDDEIIFVNIDSEYYYDAIKVDEDKKELKLLDADEKYDFAKVWLDDDEYAETATVYINGKKESVSGLYEGEEYDYAKVVLNKDGDVVFVDAYQWEDFLVVEEVDDDVVYGYGDEVDIKDFTIVKDGKTINADDLKKGDIFFFNSDAGDGYAEVYNNDVVGKVKRVFGEEKMEVNGKDYEFDYDREYAPKYLDGKEIADFNDRVADEMREEGENVTLFLDRAGNLVYVIGERGEVAKSTVVGYLYEPLEVYEQRKNVKYLGIDIVNEEGKRVSYDVKCSSIDDEDKTNIFNNNNADYSLNNDAKEADILVKLEIDADGDVVGVWVAGNDTDFATEIFNKEYKTNAKYINSKRIKPSTVVFLVEDYYAEGGDEKEIEVVKWADIEDFEEIAKEDGENKSAVYFDDKGYATYIIAVKTDVDDKVDDVKALITSIDKVKGSNHEYRVKAFVDGKEVTYYTRDKDTVGASVYENKDYVGAKLSVNKTTGDIDKITGLYAIEEQDVKNTSMNKKTIEVKANDETKEYRLVDDYYVFDAIKPTKVKTISLRGIKNGNKVMLVFDEKDTDFVKFVILTSEE